MHTKKKKKKKKKKKNYSLAWLHALTALHQLPLIFQVVGMTEMRKLKLSRGAPFMLAHGKVRLLRPYLVANQEALLPLILRATEGVPFLPMP